MPRTNLSKSRSDNTSPVSLITDTTSPDLTEILIDRLSDDLLNDIDLKALSNKVFTNIISKLKNRVIHFIFDDFKTLPLSEIEAQTVNIDAQISDIDSQKVA